jgi:hypothetical protein
VSSFARIDVKSLLYQKPSLAFFFTSYIKTNRVGDTITTPAPRNSKGIKIARAIAVATVFLSESFGGGRKGGAMIDAVESSSEVITIINTDKRSK